MLSIDAEVALDAVRVEARRGGHDAHLPRPRVERDDGPASAPELLERDLLRLEVEVDDDVVALDRLAAELVERGVHERREVRVRGGQVVVQRALEAGARAGGRRVADDVRCQLALRVPAEEERPVVDVAADVPREPPEGVAGDDQPAVDRELRDAPDRVVLPLGESGRGPGLPVRRHHDQRPDEREGDEREADDPTVHGFGAFARFETSRRPARSRKLATMLEPP